MITVSPPITDSSSHTWLNEPAIWSEDAQGLRLQTDPKTDFWRYTHDGGIRDNGHFRHRVAPTQFRANVAIQADYRDQYDQAGLMLRVDETQWLKTGIEFKDGQQFASVVVTREHSDWSLFPIAWEQPTQFHIERNHDLIEISCGPQGQGLQLMRQLTFRAQATCRIGLMAASPTGVGFEVQFLDWNLESQP